MIVLGGGYIGVEMAQIFQALGVKVTLLVRAKLLRGHVDQELIPILVENMKKLGLDVRLDTPFNGVEKAGDNLLQVNLADGSNVQAQKVLQAIGRPPNFQPLKLENAGVIVENNAIKVDDYFKTNVDGIFAIGDVINKVNLTPMAIRQGRILSKNLYEKVDRPPIKCCHENVATVIFSHPTIGTVGHSEDDAVAKYGKEAVTVYKEDFINMFYSPAATQDKKLKSMFKVICANIDGKERVVGCHAIGKGVDEMMQGISIAVTMGATKQDFDNSVAIHPTASEEWVLMKPNII